MKTSSFTAEDKLTQNQRQKTKVTTLDFRQGNQKSVSQNAYLNVLRLFTMAQEDTDVANSKPPEIPPDEKFKRNKEVEEKFYRKTKEIKIYFEENRQEEDRLDYSRPEVAIDRAQRIHNQIKNFNDDLFKQFGTGPALSQHTDGTVANKSKADTELIRGEMEQQARDSAEREKQFEWLKFFNHPKHLYEEDPIKMKIEQIAELSHSTKIFKSDHGPVKQLRGLISASDTTIESPAVSQALQGAFQEQKYEQSDEFLKELFADRLQIDSQFTTKGNFNLIQLNEQAKEPVVKNERHQEILKRLMPKWYKIANHTQNMDPSDLGDIDFFRDLGPFQRLKSEGQQFAKIKKRYFTELVEIISPEEIYLLSLSGIVPIEKLHILEQMLPNQPQLDPNQFKPIDYANLRPHNSAQQAQKASYLNEKLNDLTVVSDEVSNRFRQSRGLQLSGIEESMGESSILNSLSENDIATRLDSADLDLLRQQLEQEEISDEVILMSEEDSDEFCPQLIQNIGEQQMRQTSTNSASEKKTDFTSTITPPPRSRNRADSTIYNDNELLQSQGQVQVENMQRLWSKVEQILIEKARLVKKFGGVDRKKQGSNQPSYESRQRNLNKKIEKYLVRAIDVFDNIFEINEQLKKEEKKPIQNLILQKTASIENVNINDEIKAKFLYRVVREYRLVTEMNRMAKVKEFREKQILNHMRKELPSLSPSQSLSPERAAHSHMSRKRSPRQQRVHVQSRSPKKLSTSPSPDRSENLISSMSQGWGVSVPYRKTQQNNFTSKNPKKVQTSAVPFIDKYESIMSQSQSAVQRQKVNHFRPKKQPIEAPRQVPSVSFPDENRDQDDSWFGEEAQDEAVWI